MKKGHLEGQLLLFLQRSARGREKSIRPSLGSDTHLESLGPSALWTPWAFTVGMRCCTQGMHLLQAACAPVLPFLCVCFPHIFTLIRCAGLGFHWLQREHAECIWKSTQYPCVCVCIFVSCHVFIYSSVYLSYEQVVCQKSLFLRHFLTDLCW